ncbi:MAG: pilus assembly protein [Burkholderiaceae bacterium]|nr:pilus assembly protein [Burkholderiaceae bacterium]
MRHQPFFLSNKCSARQQGGVVVEFALILTLLISLIAGIFEFGRAFWYYDALTKATRDGARLMSVTDKATLNTAVTGGIALTKSQVAFAVADTVSGAGVPDFTTDNVEVTCLNATYDDATCTDGTAPGGVRVQIVGYTLTIGQFIPFLLGASSSYTAALSPHTTMRWMPVDAP